MKEKVNMKISHLDFKHFSEVLNVKVETVLRVGLQNADFSLSQCAISTST